MAQTLNSITSYFDEVFSDLSAIEYGRGFMTIFAQSGRQAKYVENATQIAVDLIRGKKTIPLLLSRSTVEGGITIGGNTRISDGQYFQNVAYDFPIVKTHESVKFDQVLKNRLAGRLDTDVSMDVMMKAREIMGEHIVTNIKAIAGRLEAQAVEAMTTGKCTLDDGTIYNYDRSTSLTIVPSTLWSVTATASPIGDIDDLIDAGKEKGRVTFRPFVFGFQAWEALLKTDEIKNIADNLRLHFVQAGQREQLPALPAEFAYMEDAGFTYVGYLVTYKGRKVYCFLYDEEYENSSGTSVAYLNEKDVVAFSPNVRRDRYIGPRIRFDIMTDVEMRINQLMGIEALHGMAVNEAAPTGILDARMFHHDTFLSQDKTNILVETYNGMLFVPTHVDGSGLLDGVIA